MTWATHHIARAINYVENATNVHANVSAYPQRTSMGNAWVMTHNNKRKLNFYTQQGTNARTLVAVDVDDFLAAIQPE